LESGHSLTKALFLYLCEGAVENHEDPVRIFSVSGEAQTENHPNTSIQHYHYINLLSEKILDFLCCHISETKMTREEAAVASFKVLSHHLSGGKS
jgi:hypothetical protein